MVANQLTIPRSTTHAVALEESIPLSYRVDTDHGAVRIRYFVPPTSLKSYIGSLYILSSDAENYSDVTRGDVGHLRFLLKGEGEFYFEGGGKVRVSPVDLIGPTFGATGFAMRGQFSLLGLTLLPAGWMALAQGDAHLMADNMRAVQDECGIDWAGIRSTLLGIDDLERLSEPIWAMLHSLIEAMPPLSDNIWSLLQTIDNWLTGDQFPQLETLVRETGMSSRQLGRWTNRYYGAPPNLLARKYRALRCSARIALDRESWQSLCEEGGFYDQSHFIREIKRFVGQTPQQLITKPSAVTQLVLMRRMLGSDVALLHRSY